MNSYIYSFIHSPNRYQEAGTTLHAGDPALGTMIQVTTLMEGKHTGSK